MTLLEETLKRIGYGKYQIISIFISIICISAYGINITIYASMVLPIKKFFNLNDFELSFLSSLLYVGTAMGHLVTGFITKTFTRKETVIFLLAFITIFSFLISFIKNKEIFGLFRLFIGFGVGTLLPLVINTLTEFLPMNMKGFFLMIAFSGVYLGQLIPNILMIFLIKDLDEKNVGLVFGLSSLVPFTALILSYFLFEDSPISLVIKNRTQKALALINKMDKGNFYTIEKQKMLINEMRNKFSIEGKEKNLSCLFEDNYKKSTILLSFIWFINSILFFGPAIIVSITINELGYTMNKQLILIKQALIICIGFIGFFVGGYLSEFKLFGRLRSIMTGYILLIIFTLLSMLFPMYFSIFYGFAYASIPIFYFGITIYTAEFYPCRLRDLGVGFMYFLNKMGGLGSQFMFIHLAQIHIKLPYLAIIILSLMNITFLSLLPYETLNKGMDFMEKVE